MEMVRQRLRERSEGKLRRALGSPLPGETAEQLDRIGAQDRRRAERGLVAVMDRGRHDLLPARRRPGQARYELEDRRRAGGGGLAQAAGGEPEAEGGGSSRTSASSRLNFRAIPKGEVRRRPIPRTPVNKGKKKGRDCYTPTFS